MKNPYCVICEEQINGMAILLHDEFRFRNVCARCANDIYRTLLENGGELDESPDAEWNSHDKYEKRKRGES